MQAVATSQEPPDYFMHTMTGNSQRQTVTVANPQGFHMRPMATFVELANSFPGTVTVSRCDGTASANGKSMLALMSLAAVQGTELQIELTGPQAPETIKSLVEVFHQNFEDDQEPER